MNMLIRRDENNIDKLFRQKLHDAEEETPLHLWEGIRSRTQRKKRRFIWLGLVAALLTGIAVWVINHNGENQEVIAEIAGATHNEKNTGNAESKTNNNDNTGTAPVKADISADSSAFKDYNTPVSSVESENDAVPSAAKTDAKNRAVLSQKPITPPPGAQTTPVISDTRTTNNSIGQKKNSAKDSTSDKSGSPLLTGPLSRQSIFGPEPKLADGANPARPNHTEEHAEAPALSPGSFAAIEDAVLKDDLAPISLPHTLSNNPKQDPSNWSFGVYGLMTTPYHGASKGHNAEQINALLSRTETHTGFGIGATLNYRIQPNIYIGAGIEAHSFSETHHWQDTSGFSGYFQEISYDIVYPEPGGPPVTITTIDTVFREDIQYSDHHMTNKYISVNMPLLFGWQKQYKKFMFGLEAGPVFRVHRLYKGAFVFAVSDVNSIDELAFLPPLTSNNAINENTGQNTNVGLGDYYTRWKSDLHIGLNLGYQMNRNWSAAMTIFYRQSAIIDKGNPLAHRMVQPGMRVGVLYHF
jgi:hypothetical protein